MALGGLVAGSLLGILAAGFTDAGAVRNEFRSQYNQVVDAVTQVMQNAIQDTSQTADITQKIDIGRLQCGGNVNVINRADARLIAIGRIDARSAAQIQNEIAQRIQNDITNDTKITTNPFSWLPRNTTLTDISQNMTSVIRQTYTSTNLNSIRQSLIANQVITHGVIEAGGDCNITNEFNARIIAQASLQVLSQALFTNSFTQQAMTNLRNKYVGEGRGLFDFLGDFARILAFGIIGIIIVIVIVVIVGAVLRARSGTTAPTALANSFLPLLLASVFSGSKKEKTEKAEKAE